MSTIKFGTDGWRGVIADDFTFANVRKVACAIARYVVRAEKPNAGVLVGYDTRFGSERFARAAAEVVSMTGMPVWIAEKACPSPALSLLVRQRGAAGGIMITASHNPYRWNGVKFKASYGSSALPSIVAQVEKELGRVLANGVPPLPRAPGPAFNRSTFFRRTSKPSTSWWTGSAFARRISALSWTRCTARRAACCAN